MLLVLAVFHHVVFIGCYRIINLMMILWEKSMNHQCRSSGDGHNHVCQMPRQYNPTFVKINNKCQPHGGAIGKVITKVDRIHPKQRLDQMSKK